MYRITFVSSNEEVKAYAVYRWVAFFRSSARQAQLMQV